MPLPETSWHLPNRPLETPRAPLEASRGGGAKFVAVRLHHEASGSCEHEGCGVMRVEMGEEQDLRARARVWGAKERRSGFALGGRMGCCLGGCACSHHALGISSRRFAATPSLPATGLPRANAVLCTGPAMGVYTDARIMADTARNAA